jgi:riboflavin synthase
MFTGLIETIGKVRRLDRSGNGARLVLESTLDPAEIVLGESIAINGSCLTVSAIDGKLLAFDVSPETMERTVIADCSPGTAVNMERALRLSDRLGGHIVSGHVDCVARVKDMRELSGNLRYDFILPPEFIRYVVPKGSIAVDGISLTVNEVGQNGFSVMIIPHTAGHTTLPSRRSGDRVNIETDIIGKYVERLLGGREHTGGGGLSLELLAKKGFV